jgi:hypothetical protein
VDARYIRESVKSSGGTLASQAEFVQTG